MRRPDDPDLPPPLEGAAGGDPEDGRASRSAELAARRAQRRDGRVVKVGAVIVGEWKRPTRIARPRLDTLAKQRAAGRLSELARLARWRHEHGVISEAAGWLKVAANALLVLDGTPPWRFDLSHLAGQLPPEISADDFVLRDALCRPRGRPHLLNPDTAGELVELVRVEHDDLILIGGPFRTLNPIDETPAQREARRVARDRLTGAERKARFDARKKAAANATRPVTPQEEERSSMNRYHAHVASAIVAAVSGGATAIDEIAAAICREPAKIRREVERAAQNSLIRRTGRGRYGPLPVNSLPTSAAGGVKPPSALEEE